MHNLPAQLTSFVGRERELSEVSDALAQTRFLTLTGAGGCGKSRLALETAVRSLGRYPDGVWWVELAGVTEPSLVEATLTHALGIRPPPHETHLEAAVAYLRARRALLLLDNCEHVLDASARAAETLARACPDLRVLATSREPLRVEGETDWRVPSLTLPPEAGDRATDLEACSDAVRLFVERARKVRPGFEVTADTASALARICRDLDGIPLAIELAAARLRHFSVEQIADGLHDRFRLLTGRSRTALPRHQTLRASVEWSYDLLEEPERVVFRRLGVFMEGFTLDAAEAVCTGDEIARSDVLDVLGALVDKSLVQAEERDGDVRYRLLETVRQYALERLAEAGEMERTRDAHADAYLDLAERIGPIYLGPEAPRLLDVLEREAPNFAQAVEWTVSTDPDKALRLCVALFIWWRTRGHFQQGEVSFKKALEAVEPRPSSLRARAVLSRATLLTFSGNEDLALPVHEEAIAEAERCGDVVTLGFALWMAGVCTANADPLGCRATVVRAREVAKESNNYPAYAFATMTSGMTYTYQDDHVRAREFFDEALPVLERMGHQETLAWRWGCIAWAQHVLGDLQGCREACERGLAAARSIGEVSTEALSLGHLALTEIDAGEHEAALTRLEPVREGLLAKGENLMLPFIEVFCSEAHAAGGDLEEARSNLESLIARGATRNANVAARSRRCLAEVLRLLGHADSEDVARSALELATRLDNRLIEAQARIVLGRLSASREGWTEARRLHHDALSAVAERGYRRELPVLLEALAEVAAGLESHAEAARLLGAAARGRAETGLVAWKPQRDELDALVARVREVLVDGPFGEAYAEGHALSLDEAVAYVRRARGARKRPSAGWESLTPTELEVVRHAAAGLTNTQIAERMFIAPGTVKAHLSRIYGKLGVKNRADLARVATSRGVS